MKKLMFFVMFFCAVFGAIGAIGDSGHAWLLSSGDAEVGEDYVVTLQANSPVEETLAGPIITYDTNKFSITEEGVVVLGGLELLPRNPVVIEEGTIRFGVHNGVINPINIPGETMDLAELTFTPLVAGNTELSLNVMGTNGITVSESANIRIIAQAPPPQEDCLALDADTDTNNALRQIKTILTSNNTPIQKVVGIAGVLRGLF